MAFAPSTTAVGPVSIRLHHLHWSGDVSIFSFSQSRFRRSDKKTRNGFLFMDVKAVAVKPDIDFEDANWKKHFQEDWDRRFNLPHLTDILDVMPRPTTFSLKKRGSPENINGASNDRRNDYVYNDDRALLKVHSC